MRRIFLGIGCALLLSLASCGSNEGEKLGANQDANSTISPGAAASSENAPGAMLPGQKSALARGADGEKRDFLSRQHADFSAPGAKLSVMRAFPSSLAKRQAKQLGAPANIEPTHPSVYLHPAVLAKHAGMEKAQLDQQDAVVARQLPQRTDVAIQLPARKSAVPPQGQ